MWLKSINHQSNSLGNLTHELKGRSGVGSVKKAFSEHSLSLVQTGREKQGHYPLKCWVLGALSELFDICGLPLLLSNHFSLAGLKRQRPTSVSKSKVRWCERSRVWMWIWSFSWEHLRSLWIGPVQSLSEAGLGYFFYIQSFFFLPFSPRWSISLRCTRSSAS